jgi:hypothetical protein
MGLFTPAWKSKNEKRARRAVEKMTDQKKLARVAKEAENKDVRHAALNRINDVKAIISILMQADSEVALSAFEKISSNLDDDSLQIIVKMAISISVRAAAVKKITKDLILAGIAKEGSSSYIREMAIKNPNLTDQHVLAYVAKMDSTREVRMAADEKLTTVRVAAAKKITDQRVLADYAKNSDNWKVREVAVAKLTDRSMLADFAKNDSSYVIRRVAAANPYLTDQNVLADVAKNDSNSDVRAVAIANPNFTNQNVLADVAKMDNDRGVRKAAVKKLTDQQAIADVFVAQKFLVKALRVSDVPVWNGN